jgi:hypothetical protein
VCVSYEEDEVCVDDCDSLWAIASSGTLLASSRSSWLRLLGPSTLTKLLERAVVGDGGGSLVLRSSQNKRKSMEGRGEIVAALGRELGLGL